MDLLRGQDFRSRLSKVGQPDADRIIEIFNKMIEQLNEERLRYVEQNYFQQLLIQASPLGIAILDFDGKVTLVNPVMASFLLAEPNDIIGKRLSDFDGEIAEAISGTAQGESRTMRFSDTSIIRISRLSFMESGYQRPYVLVESLTKEVMLAEKEAYGKVIRLIAHEVNNTMGGVSSILETMSLIMENEPDLTEAMDSCRERCSSLSEFITSYADVVRIPPVKLTPVNLNAKIEKMLPFLEGLTGQKIKLHFIPAATDLIVNADTVLMEQVIVNIVKNSRESILTSFDEGIITIRLSNTAPHIEITDNGKGISREASQKLFTPFFSTKPGGQGIGLTMVGDILHQHGCMFSLRTDSSGSETRPLTRFRITFRIE